jgi:hypothetical protein
MKNTLFLLISLLGVNCIAQNNRLTVQNRHSSFRSTLINTNRTEIESSIMGRPNFRMKKKMPATYLHSKQKSLTQLIDSVYMWRWDTTSADWALDYKYSVEQFDANNNPLAELGQIWNGTDWENYWQETYTYDVENNMTSASHQDWIGNQWVDNGLNTYVYDSNNNLVSSVTQVDNDAELVTSEISYFYDAGNKLISDSTYTWGNSWDYIRLGTYTYDTYGNLINWLSQSKNGDYPENINRTIFTYDDANNLTSEIRQDWKDNSWVNLDFDRHSFNENNLLTSDAYKYWNSAGTKVMEGDSSTYYYHDAITGINEIERAEENICIYPNPNSGKFTLTSNSIIQSIVIFNINGKRIYTDSGFTQQMQKEIDLSDYDKGVYLLKIKTSTGIETKKLFIQ